MRVGAHQLLPVELVVLARAEALDGDFPTSNISGNKFPNNDHSDDD